MIVFRLSRSVYANDLSGRGAEIAGGRWNNKGIPLIYTAQNISLCMAEVAVHLPLGILPKDYTLISIEIPDDDFEVFSLSDFKVESIRDLYYETTQKIGNEFVKNSAKMMLKVPSVVVQGEFNILINPRHSDIHKVKIIKTETFEFDRRLFVR
ncbi:MAG: RES family NAD+ phosphorylase [Weeksellaceae bacterium]